MGEGDKKRAEAPGETPLKGRATWQAKKLVRAKGLEPS